MKKFFLFLIILSVFGCHSADQKKESSTGAIPQATKDTLQKLSAYWELTDAESPSSRDVAYKDENGISVQSGIVFMTDSNLLENPAGDKTYGTFSLKGNTIEAKYDDGRKAVYTITGIDSNSLQLTRLEDKRNSQLSYKGTGTYWPDASKNPFAKANYQWSFKPKKAEDDEALKKRLKQNVLFYADYFDGLVNGGAKQIDFSSLPCCFNWYAGGITIQGEKKLDKKWINCFYSTEQALKARQILEDALMKDHHWDTTETNWVKQIPPVLRQVSQHL
jgi:Lipocalin-like domain